MAEEHYERVDDKELYEVVKGDRYRTIDRDAEVYEPYEVIVEDEEVIAKPKVTRTEDFVDALTEAVWYGTKLYAIRRDLKKWLMLMAHNNRRISQVAQKIAEELLRDERRIAKRFYEARKRARMLCEFKYREAHACEKCIYSWICWGRIRAP